VWPINIEDDKTMNGKHKLSIKELRAQLGKRSKKELVDLLVDSFKMSNDVQGYISGKIKEEELQPEHTQVISIEAASKWMKIPQGHRDELLSNVWCGKCGDVVTIVDYTIKPDKFGVVLEGKCKNAGHQVARVVEIEN
jgi:hypothetical protein